MIKNNYYTGRSTSLIEGIDWITVLIYVALVLLGWVSIYAAVYNEEHSSMFDMSQKYGSQIMWIGICSVIGLFLLLLDSKYFYNFSYLFYVIMILVSIGVLFGGTTVNGAKSWISVGSFRVQPAEFLKVATALTLARYMSNHGFSIDKSKGVISVFALIAIPALVIIVQNDTGSALVFGSFLILFYREGLNGWLYIIIFLMIVIFILSFIINPLYLIFLLFLFMVLADVVMNGNIILKIKYVAAVLLSFLFFKGVDLVLSLNIRSEYLLLFVISLSLVFVVYYMYKMQLQNMILSIFIFIGSSLFLFSVDYIFNSVMKIHQQKRILDLLGLESDVKGWGYNVNQSKIAIGSGGFSGKGFLQGTQTKYDFVPEQSTDFIFCTISEEWGFLGSSLVVILFVALIVRLMQLGDRQNDAFGRVYCYGAASIFTFHVLVNIGMTIGVMPVIGIPLPFFSYGGSSLLAFTVLLFIAVKLDSDRSGTMNNFYR
ncbi:MAG: rod shape-determining protein RodA [Rikenellaceae bacterium]